MQLTDEQIRALLRDPARHPSARHLGFELIDFSVAECWAEVAFMPRGAICAIKVISCSRLVVIC
jgi:hypothetical protein